MEWDVTDVRIIGDYCLWVRFKDGVDGMILCKPSFFRGVFSHLSDKKEFQRVAVVDGIVTWPGELDLAPDTMHEAIKQRGEWVLE
jgi:hypothetical protein